MFYNGPSPFAIHSLHDIWIVYVQICLVLWFFLALFFCFCACNFRNVSQGLHDDFTYECIPCIWILRDQTPGILQRLSLVFVASRICSRGLDVLLCRGLVLGNSAIGRKSIYCSRLGEVFWRLYVKHVFLAAL